MFNENESTTYGKCGLKSGIKKQNPGMLTEGQTELQSGLVLCYILKWVAFLDALQSDLGAIIPLTFD